MLKLIQTQIALLKRLPEKEKMNMHKKIIVANWKLNIPNLRSWRSFRAPRGADVVICPPFTLLERIKSRMSSIKKGDAKLGAQDCFWEEKGAYTGEVSPKMLRLAGAEYVILGHSERRRWFGETDEMVNKKVRAALRAGIRVILCVGEPWVVRKKGLIAAKHFVAAQLRKDLAGLTKAINHRLVIAYEPVWAIGTGRADGPEEAAEMAKFIKNQVPGARHLVPVLYGGSVNGKNAASFLGRKEIDGALVGGASLKVREFEKIARAAA